MPAPRSWRGHTLAEPTTAPRADSLPDRLAWLGVLATTTLVPVVFTTRTEDVFTLTKVTALLLATCAMGALWVLAAGWQRPRPPHVPLAGLYLGAVAVTTGWSRSPEVSFVGMYGRFGGLLTSIAVVSFSLAAAQLLMGRGDRQRQLLWAMALSGVIGAGYLVIQWAGWDWFEWGPSQFPPGVMGNSNFSGAHAALGAVAALHLMSARSASRGLRIVAVVATALTSAGVLISASRGAMLALVAGAAWLGTRRPQWRQRLRERAPLVLLVAVLVVAVAAGSERFSAATVDQRLDVWEVALRGVPGHALVGGGPDLFLATFAEHRNEVAELRGVVADEPHNIVLDVLDGSGLVGLAMWVGLLAFVAGRRSRAGTGFVAVGLAYLVQGFVSIDVVGLQLLGWLAAAGVVAAATEVPAEPAAAPPRWRGLRLLALPAALALGALALLPLRADLAYRAGERASASGAPVEVALDHFAVAVDRNPWQPVYHLRYARELRRAAQSAGRDAASFRAAAAHQRFLAERLLPREVLRLLDG